MSQPLQKLQRFLRELKRRRVWRVAAVYAVVGWLVIQVAVATFPLLFLPEWMARAVVVLVLLGFPVALVLAWAFERTPEGLQRTGADRSGRTSGEVEEASASGAAASAGASAFGAHPRRAVLVLFGAGLVVAAAAYWAVAGFQGFPDGRELNRTSPGGEGSEAGGVAGAHLHLALPSGVTLAVDSDYPVLAISPDGSRLVFVGEREGRRRLYSRLLVDSAFHPIPGTEGAYAPFFSPDGEWIAFFSGSRLFRVATSGGRPEAVSTITGEGVTRGATWVGGDRLVYVASPNSGLWTAAIPDDGLDGRVRQDWEMTSASVPAAWPARGPRDDEVLFTRTAPGSEAQVARFSFQEGKTETLVNGATNASYAPTGHLLFAREDVLYAVGYDPHDGETFGPERKLVPGVAAGGYGVSHYAVGGRVLAYLSGGEISREFELVWVDRSGAVLETLHEGRQYAGPRVSPAGDKVAVTITEGPNSDIWVLDLRRNTLQPLTRHPGEDLEPVWSPDGSSLAIASEVGEDRGEIGPALAWLPDLRGPPEKLSSSPEPGAWEFPGSWTPDGRAILVTTRRADRLADIALVSVEGDGELTPVLDSPDDEVGGRISPDGRWLAYVSDRSGRDEIWIRPFPGPGSGVQVSTEGGYEPAWSPDSRELFYRSALEVMVVDVAGGTEVELSPPRRLFQEDFERNLFGGKHANYDVGPEGERFLMVRRMETVQPTVIEVVLNWPMALLSPWRQSN